MLVSPANIRILMQATRGRGPRLFSARRPIAIALSHQDKIRLSGGDSPPQEPNGNKKIINLALGNISLLAGGLICALSGTLVGLLLLPPAFLFLTRAFHKP